MRARSELEAAARSFLPRFLRHLASPLNNPGLFSDPEEIQNTATSEG